MFLTSPIWLLGLLPWTAVVVYMFIGTHRKQSVPFLLLWSGVVSNPKPKRSVHRPPWFVILLLISMLLAILGAAGPGIRLLSGKGEITTIILDRGITMSPVGRDGKPFRGVLSIAGPFNGPVELISVPGESVRCTGSDWIQIAERLPPTALDTQAAIEETVAQQLRNSTDAVIVLTDRILDQTDNRLVQIPPQDMVEDVGIADVAARSKPHPQVMVRVRNQSQLESVSMRITSGGQSVSPVVKLPAAGQTRDYFIDMPGPLDDVVAVEIDVHDEAAVNDRAWLVREKSWPVVEVRGALPLPVTKLIGVYSKSRPAGFGSAHILVCDQRIPPGENGVWLVDGTPDTGDSRAAIVVPHPITDGIEHWPKAANSDEGLPSGFELVVRRAGKAIVGFHQDGARQAWVNLDLEDWSRTPDFVVFFANVFDWINAGRANEFVGHRVSGIGGESGSSEYPFGGLRAGLRTGVWSWPGLYRGADGHLIAVNAPDVHWLSPPVTHWREKLAEAASHGLDNTSEQSWFWLVALLCALGAAVIWEPAHP